MTEEDSIILKKILKTIELGSKINGKTVDTIATLLERIITLEVKMKELESKTEWINKN